MGSPLEQLMKPRAPGYFAGLTRTADPDNSVLLSTVKAHLRITSSAEDTLLQLYIDGAVRYVETVSRRSLLTQAYQLVLDSFPADDYLDLYQGPIQSIDTFTTYDDANDPTTTFSAYVLDDVGDRLLLNDGATWPTDLRAHASVAIDYTTGFGADLADIPGTFLRAVLLLTGEFYANRDVSCTPSTESAMGVSDLLASERRWRL